MKLNAKNTTDVTSTNFDAEVLKATGPVVVDFWAPWCGPCRQIGPVLERLGGEYDGAVKVVKVNVDKERELARQFRVQGIPTLVVMQGGKPTKQIVGFEGERALESLFGTLAKKEHA